MAKNTDPRFDAYIAKSAEFARPILKHLRKLVHAGCPEVEEEMKWSCPHFTYHGSILCSMAAFKAHCAFGFWHQDMAATIGKDGGKAEAAMGQFGRITSLADLPDDAAMNRYIQESVALSASGKPVRPRPTTDKTKVELPVPDDLAAALKKNKAAAATFEKFSPSNRKDYIEWITEAKRDETRQKRLATTLEWLAEGKPRNWKYMNC